MVRLMRLAMIFPFQLTQTSINSRGASVACRTTPERFRVTDGAKRRRNDGGDQRPGRIAVSLRGPDQSTREARRAEMSCALLHKCSILVQNFNVRKGQLSACPGAGRRGSAWISGPRLLFLLGACD